MSDVKDRISGLGAGLRRRMLRRPRQPERLASAECSWDTMREVYQAQADRGVREAERGLRLIEQDRWPSSGQPRQR